MKAILFTSLLLLICCAYAQQHIYVKNSMLFVNGQEFFVKGIAYSPSPIGQSGMNPSGWGGTGFCSVKLTPWGEYKSACYDSDYFDGSTDRDPTRFPNGFKPLWERDIPKMKQAGANTVRLYNANPSTKVATLVYKNLFQYSTGKDHSQFMKYCEQQGIYVIYPLLSDNTMFNDVDEATYKRYLRWQIDEVGNSSALLMWQLGNEMGWSWGDSTWNSATVIAKMNRYFNYARKYTLSKWGRNIPVTSAFQYTQDRFTTWISQLHIDVFSANVFGTSFGNLFSGGTNWQGITKLTCRYNRPMLLTEFGPTYETNKVYNTGAINQIWYNIIQNAGNGLLGGIWFELTDEPAHGKDFGLFKVAITKVAAGVNSSTTDVWVPDTLVAKQQWTDITTGKYNNKPYNMVTNVWTSFFARSPRPYSTTNNRCSSVGTYKTCPGTGDPKCSGNGICDRSTGTCVCASGWSGSSCSTAKCPGTTACSGRGTCNNKVTPPECVCNSGYFGSSCQSTVASVAAGTCPGGCSLGNGVCNTTSRACACWPGWRGPDCAVHSF